MKTGANDILGSLSPASLPDRIASYALDAAKSAYRLLVRRVERTRDKVDSEYDRLHWQKVRTRKAWRDANSLADFLVAFPDQGVGLRKIDGKILRISAAQYYRYRLTALSELIAQHAGGAKQIVELGAGFGYNLFSLQLAHPDWTFKGFDISPNGIATGREIAADFDISDKVKLDHIDLTNVSDPNFVAIKDEVVLTYFCIEQIPYDVRKVVENIIAHRPRRVINIEPNAELLDLTSPRDIISLLYIRSVDYQTMLFSTLEQLEREGRIRIVARQRMPFAPTINNDGFLYCWEPL